MQEVKEFYTELYKRLKEILKPYGFKKKKDCFRCLLKNGLIWEIEIQRNESAAIMAYDFTVWVNIGLNDSSEQHDVWALKWVQNRRALGTVTDGQWNRQQKWYRLGYQLVPHLKAQIINGKIPMEAIHSDTGTKETWHVSAPTFDEIISEVSKLVKHQAVPLFLSVQTLDEYWTFLETDNEFEKWDDIALYADVFGVKFKPRLKDIIAKAENALDYDISQRQETKKYSVFYQQALEKSIVESENRIKALKEIENSLDE